MRHDISEDLFLGKMRLAVESSMDGIALLDPRGHYYYLNEVHVAMFGYSSQDELIGKSWEILYGSAEIERIGQHIFPLLSRDGKWRGETVGKSRDGQPVYQEITLTILDDGGMICVCRDIADRLRSQRELQHRDKILAKTNSMVIITNRRREITWVNESFCRITGYSREEATGKNPGQLLQGPASNAAEIRRFREALGRGEDYHGELLNYRKDGRPYWIDIRCQPLRNEQGEIAFYFATEDDITARKQAEILLEEQQRRLEMAIDVSGAALWDWDIARNTVYYSAAWKKVLGYREDEVGTSLDEWTSRIHPEDKERSVNNVRDYLAGRSDRYECEVRLRHKKGHYLWFLDRGEILHYDEAGHPSRMVGIAFNVSLLKQTQEEVKRSEQRYRLALEASGAAIWEWDVPTGQIQATNEFISLFGLQEFREAGAPITYDLLVPLVHPEDLPLLVKAFQDNFSGVTSRFDHEYRQRKPGQEEYSWFHIQGGVMERNPEGKPLKAMGYSTSIQRRKDAEEKLRENEARWNAALDGSAFGVWDWDMERDQLYFSPKLKELYGYGPEELDPTPSFWLNNTHPDDRSLIEQMVTGGYTFSEDNFRMDRRILHRDGKYRWFQSRGIIIKRDANGKPLRVVGSVADITERKQLEEELIRARDTAELNVKAKRRFLANISHEIRTPIHAIVGLAEQLAQLVQEEKQRDYLRIINESAHHLLSIISDVIDISRIEEGKISLDEHDFRLQDCVRSAYDLFADAAERKGLRYQLNLDERINRTYSGDAPKIRQLLLNILSNAVKFTEKGSVTLACRWLGHEAGKDRVEIRCTDTGIGMSEDMKSRLFRDFSQEDESFIRKYGGSGLGLAITHELVRLMGGQIEVESTKEAGTTVIIELPLLTVKSEAPVLPVPKPDHSGLAGMRVLAVEDNHFNRLLMQIMFENLGVDADIAVSGREAVDRALAKNYDVILMDIQMPEMDGLEAMEKIRAVRGASLPIIAVTANAVETELQDYLGRGMTDYLTKPFEEEALLQKLLLYNTR